MAWCRRDRPADRVSRPTSVHRAGQNMNHMSVSRRLLLQAVGRHQRGTATMTASGVTAQGEKVSRIHAKTDIVSVDTPSPSCTDDTNVRQAIHSNLKLFKPGPTWIWQLDATACIEQVDPTHVDVPAETGNHVDQRPGQRLPLLQRPLHAPGMAPQRPRGSGAPFHRPTDAPRRIQPCAHLTAKDAGGRTMARARERPPLSQAASPGSPAARRAWAAPWRWPLRARAPMSPSAR